MNDLGEWRSNEIIVNLGLMLQNVYHLGSIPYEFN